MTKSQYSAWYLNLIADARREGRRSWVIFMLNWLRAVRKGEIVSDMITKGV